MKTIVLLLFAFGIVAGVLAVTSQASGQAQENVSPVYGIEIPAGYRTWQLISVANVGAPVNDIRAKLGNDIAIKAYQEGKVPFPDGAIIARLAWHQVISDDNNNAIRPIAEKQLAPDQVKKLLDGSFVAGPPINVQFMVKDSKKFASTGGWGFAQFTDGKPADEATLKTCFACHQPAKEHDFVFTHYAQ